MKIHFTKMQGTGNDYIYISCADKIPFDPAALASVMCPRRLSVGADGIVLICPSQKADAAMRIFNADGSEGKMCGNAIRCVGKYLWDSRAVRETTLTVETLSGVKTLTLRTNGAVVSSVSVDMGYAEFAPEKIPVLSGGKMIGSEITAGGMRARVTALSVGNPHAVVFCGDIASLDLEKIGSAFEHHPLFPERVNTEFVRIISRTEIEMRVWERGSGETWACGTGACAAVCAAVENSLCDAETDVRVRLHGGELTVRVGADRRITMEGDAVWVYDGTFDFRG